RHGQAVLQPAPAAEIEIGVGTEIDTVGFQAALVRITADDLGDAAGGRVAGDAQAGRDLAVGARVQVLVDDVLATEAADVVLDFDVVVVDAQIQPVDRVIDHTDAPLGGLLGGQRRVGDEVRVDLDRGRVAFGIQAGRRQVVEHAAGRIGH